jgi:very-short-patch-repair endonuclease
MKPLRWTTDREKSAYMRERRAQNLQRSLCNPNENWLWDKLKATGLKWKRQAVWGFRIFDFWCHEKGIAVESDGKEHDPAYDAHRDEYNLRRSAIVVLRLRNKNESDLAMVLEQITSERTWKERRDAFGLNVSGKKARRKLVLPAGH